MPRGRSGSGRGRRRPFNFTSYTRDATPSTYTPGIIRPASVFASLCSMADDARKKLEKEAPTTVSYLRAWGESPLPPTILATLITAQHARPLQVLPMLFPVALLGGTYMNLNDAKVDAAGFSAAWSALYALLASRRKQSFRSKWGPRGVLRGTTILGCLAQVAAGGWVYATGRGFTG